MRALRLRAALLRLRGVTVHFHAGGLRVLASVSVTSMALGLSQSPRAGVSLLAAGAAAACGNRAVPSPFVHEDGGRPDGADGASDGGASDDAPSPAEDAAGGAGAWGGPCLDDGQCNDTIACTTDRCEARRCHFLPEDALCDDGVYCDGVELCAPGVGCRSGEAVACSDGTACTIDSCDEATRRCDHAPRDADGDGDADGNCPEGGDCDDRDPLVSSLATEVCSNTLDDDCDGQIDETDDCEEPRYDGCTDPLEIDSPGLFDVSITAASLDFAASCFSAGARSRDLAAALHVPAGDPVDVDVVLTGQNGEVALAAAVLCGDASTEIACAAGAPAPAQNRVARLRLHSLQPGTYPLYLFSDAGGSLSLSVDFVPPETAPDNETCGTATAITPGVGVVASLVESSVDLTSACGTGIGDLVYELLLEESRDVHVFATPRDLNGTPILSLRNASCDGEGAELTCHQAENDSLFRRDLPPGHYFIGVAATGPTELDLLVETAAPTAAPTDESCVGAPWLEANHTTIVDLEGHEDDIRTGCAVGRTDAAYALTLGADSDVLLVQQISGNDEGSISLTSTACDTATVPLACASSTESPNRAAAHGVPAGEYRVVVESERGSATSVTALVRPAFPPMLVPFSDGCVDATEIPPDGGFFQGNTANVADDFIASCDVGGSVGSPDQILRLHLDEPRRVVLDARGSVYATIIDVRSGPACPGTEVAGGCSAGYVRNRSYVDVMLPAGDHWVQIDGYNDDSGGWALDVFVVPP